MQIPPSLAARYEILRKLGEGAGGATWLVRQKVDGASLEALKVQPLDEKKAVERRAFENECRLLRELSHPHIASLRDFGTAGPCLYYTSEFVEGDNLVAESRKRDWNAVFSLIVQVAWALQYLQDRGIVHRDIKPDNILVGKVHAAGSQDLSDRLRLKIIDFGLAGAVGAGHGEVGKAGKVAGTLPYMAPEILAGREGDHRADLYSFGVVLYEMAWGRQPVPPGGSFSKYLETLTHGEIDLKPLKDWGVPRGLQKLIENLVVRDPLRRLGRADQMIALLNEAEAEHFPLKPPAFVSPGEGERKEPEFSDVPKTTVLPPAEALETLRRLARSGDREAAVTFSGRYLDEIKAWTDRDIVEGFYASVLAAMTDQGRYGEAEKILAQFQEHPRLQGSFSIEASLARAYLAYRQGDHRLSGEVLENSAAAMGTARPDQWTRYETYQAFVAQARKEWEKAAGHYEKAAVFAEESGRKDHEVALLSNAGALCLEQGQWSRSFALFQKALGVAEKLDQQKPVASLLNNLGNLYLQFGRWTEAGDALEKSLRMAREQNLKPLIASNLHLLTVAEEGRGNRERVRFYLDQSLAFARELGDVVPILQSLLAKGYEELSRSDYDACEKSLEDLRRRSEEKGRPDFLLQAAWLQARLAMARGFAEDPGVEEALVRVEEDARKRGSGMALWQVLADRGELARARGDCAKAKTLYEESLQWIERQQEKIPAAFRESFLRDRKKEKLRQALEGLTVVPEARTDVATMETVMNPLFQKMLEINRRLLAQRQVDPLLEEILDAAIELTEAERGFVIHSDRQDLTIRAARNFQKESLEKEEERFSCTIARQVLRKGESTLLLDAQQDARFSQAASVHELGVRSALCVPLRAGPLPVGLIYLDNRFRQGIFRQEHLPLLEAFADQASIILEQARLHQQNESQIDELKRSRKTIEELNAKLARDLEETVSDLHVMQESVRRQNEEAALRFTYDKIIGESPQIREVLKTIDRIIETQMPVYIYGESGTGKELIAHAIHSNSSRKAKNFVAINCASLAETLLESELFGHLRGAFTGAIQDRVGLFEVADGGSLFLDEIGDMPPTMQAKLLRVLQEGEVRRVGGQETRKVDVRIIAASNKDLKELVRQGKFREDLFYRLHVARIRLPALRQRREDIPILIRHFMKQESERAGTKPPKISKEAMKVLLDYEWPGNIRELQNEISRLVIFGPEIRTPLLSPQIVEDVRRRASAASGGMDEALGRTEKQLILEALQKTGGNKVKASRLLKIGRQTLYTKLELYKIGGKGGRGSSES